MRIIFNSINYIVNLTNRIFYYRHLRLENSFFCNFFFFLLIGFIFFSRYGKKKPLFSFYLIFSSICIRKTIVHQMRNV